MPYDEAGFELQLWFGYGSFLLAMVHFLQPMLGFGGMWRMGLNTRRIRSVKARKAMAVRLLGKKNRLPGALKVENRHAAKASV